MGRLQGKDERKHETGSGGNLHQSDRVRSCHAGYLYVPANDGAGRSLAAGCELPPRIGFCRIHHGEYVYLPDDDPIRSYLEKTVPECLSDGGGAVSSKSAGAGPVCCAFIWAVPGGCAVQQFHRILLCLCVSCPAG